jgi:hypothetical protein
MTWAVLKTNEIYKLFDNRLSFYALLEKLDSGLSFRLMYISKRLLN